MFSLRTRKVALFLLALYLLLWIPYFIWPGYLESPVGVVAVVPVFSLYVFHDIGIPGLLQRNGACGWGWCAPSAFGWAFVISFWLIVVWVLSWLISSLFGFFVRGLDDESGSNEE